MEERNTHILTYIRLKETREKNDRAKRMIVTPSGVCLHFAFKLRATEAIPKIFFSADSNDV